MTGTEAMIVTQEDVNAAADYLSLVAPSFPNLADAIRANPTAAARAFARHRIAAEQRARIAPASGLGLVEELARALCMAGGFDPDEIMANDGPRWRYYVPQATAILPIIERARIEWAQAERERVVTWLRDGAKPGYTMDLHDADELADAIEAGEHIPPHPQ